MARKTQKAWEQDNPVVAESTIKIPLPEPMESIKVETELTVPVVPGLAEEEAGGKDEPQASSDNLNYMPYIPIVEPTTPEIDLEKTVDGGVQTDDQGYPINNQAITGFAPPISDNENSVKQSEEKWEELKEKFGTAKEQKFFDEKYGKGAVKVTQEFPPIEEQEIPPPVEEIVDLPKHPHNHGVERKVINLSKDEEKKEHPGKALIKRLMRNGTVGGFKRRDKV